MDRIWVALGNLLIITASLGVAGVALDQNLRLDSIGAPAVGESPRAAHWSVTDSDRSRRASPDVLATPRSDRAISRVIIRRIGLDAPVVPAALLEQDGEPTWQVPAFSAGHAQGTAGAGDPGNAVLFGHVSSRNEGNVFRELERVIAGDRISAYSGADRFDYRVVAVRQVSRDDVSVVGDTQIPSLSLITCAGLWLPLVWDYLDRLVVRAELVAIDPLAAPNLQQEADASGRLARDRA